jgi:hypothetical protein
VERLKPSRGIQGLPLGVRALTSGMRFRKSWSWTSIEKPAGSVALKAPVGKLLPAGAHDRFFSGSPPMKLTGVAAVGWAAAYTMGACGEAPESCAPKLASAVLEYWVAVLRWRLGSAAP